jgi:hypothetical protein
MNPSSTERTTEYWLSKKNRTGRIEKSTVPMRSLLVCMSPRLLEKGDVRKEHLLTANSFSPCTQGRGEKVKAQKTVYCCLQPEDRIFSTESQGSPQETSKSHKPDGSGQNQSNLRRIEGLTNVALVPTRSRHRRTS